MLGMPSSEKLSANASDSCEDFANQLHISGHERSPGLIEREYDDRFLIWYSDIDN
jgi:hypothetical protein